MNHFLEQKDPRFQETAENSEKFTAFKKVFDSSDGFKVIETLKELVFTFFFFFLFLIEL